MSDVTVFKHMKLNMQTPVVSIEQWRSRDGVAWWQYVDDNLYARKLLFLKHTNGEKRIYEVTGPEDDMVPVRELSYSDVPSYAHAMPTHAFTNRRFIDEDF